MICIYKDGSVIFFRGGGLERTSWNKELRPQDSWEETFMPQISWEQGAPLQVNPIQHDLFANLFNMRGGHMAHMP